MAETQTVPHPLSNGCRRESLATDWEISLVSVTHCAHGRVRPIPTKRLRQGCCPGYQWRRVAQIHEESAEQVLFVCTWSGDFAKSDQTLAVRMLVDGNS